MMTVKPMLTISIKMKNVFLLIVLKSFLEAKSPTKEEGDHHHDTNQPGEKTYS